MKFFPENYVSRCVICHLCEKYLLEIKQLNIAKRLTVDCLRVRPL